MSKIFRQCMPYGIRKTAEGAWEEFNRDYQPLGEAFFFKRALTQATRDVLAPPPVTQRDDCVWLYSDIEHPMHSEAYWKAYCQRLKHLSNLKMKDER